MAVQTLKDVHLLQEGTYPSIGARAVMLAQTRWRVDAGENGGLSGGALWTPRDSERGIGGHQGGPCGTVKSSGGHGFAASQQPPHCGEDIWARQGIARWLVSPKANAINEEKNYASHKRYVLGGTALSGAALGGAAFVPPPMISFFMSVTANTKSCMGVSVEDSKRAGPLACPRVGGGEGGI